MDIKKLNEKELEQITGGAYPDQEWQVLTSTNSALPKDFDTDAEPVDLEKVKDNGRLL